MEIEQKISFNRDAISGAVVVSGRDINIGKVVSFAKKICLACPLNKNGTCLGATGVDDDYQALLNRNGLKITAKPCNLVGLVIDKNS